MLYATKIFIHLLNTTNHQSEQKYFACKLNGGKSNEGKKIKEFVKKPKQKHQTFFLFSFDFFKFLFAVE